MNYLTSSVSKLRSNRMNRTYFEPKQLNPDDHLNLLNKNGNQTDGTLTDTDLDEDDIELIDKLKHKLDESHQSLIDGGLNDVLGDIDTTNVCHEWVKATAWRIKQSVQFFLVYLILIVLNAFILIWEVSDGGDRKICIILEGIITLMFMGEVSVQIITEEWNEYWSSWLNRIDFIICIICVLLYIMFASVESAPHSHYSVGNYMDAIIVGIRYGMQAVRLIRFAQRGHENRKMLNQTEVKFNSASTLSVLSKHGVSLPSNKGSSNEINSIELTDINIENKISDDDDDDDDILDKKEQSDIYTTDDTNDNMMNELGFIDNKYVYDSEQMAVYQNISNERINSDGDGAII